MANQIAKPEYSSAETPNDPSSEALLKDVWERHRVYSDNASRAQNRFFLIRRILAYLSVTIVVLAIVQPFLERAYDEAVLSSGADAAAIAAVDPLWSWFTPNGADAVPWLLITVNFLLILLPIIVTGMLAFAVKFDRGNSWVMLRGNSEALKMEIFLYRTQVKEYRQHRNAVLAEKVQQISERVKSTSVHEAALSPYEWETENRVEMGWVFRLISHTVAVLQRAISKLWDSLFRLKILSGGSRLPASNSQDLLKLSQEEYEYQKKYADLNAEKYLHFRLEKQFDWYRKKCKTYDRQNQLLQSSIYFFAGLGTLFAAISQQYLIPISAAVSTALVNYLEYRRVEATLIGYNQAADALYDIHVWWYSLSPSAQNKRGNFEKLVVNTEETIRIENSSWLQDMQERLSSLYGEDDNAPSNAVEAANGQAEVSAPKPLNYHPTDSDEST